MIQDTFSSIYISLNARWFWNQVLFGFKTQSYENGKYRVRRLDGDLDQGFQITRDEHNVEKVRVIMYRYLA